MCHLVFVVMFLFAFTVRFVQNLSKRRLVLSLSGGVLRFVSCVSLYLWWHHDSALLLCVQDYWWVCTCVSLYTCASLESLLIHYKTDAEAEYGRREENQQTSISFLVSFVLFYFTWLIVLFNVCCLHTVWSLLVMFICDTCFLSFACLWVINVNAAHSSFHVSSFMLWNPYVATFLQKAFIT